MESTDLPDSERTMFMPSVAERLVMSASPHRLDRSVATVALIVGDAAIIAAQLAIGLITHGTDPFAAPAYTAETVAPFLFAWLLVAPMLGAYTTRVRTSIVESVLAVGVAWTIAVLIGTGLRASSLFVGSGPPVFVAVTAGTGLATLLPWRIVVAALTR